MNLEKLVRMANQIAGFFAHEGPERATASIEDSKKVVEICTLYAQKGMINIFLVVFCFSLALPFFNAY